MDRRCKIIYRDIENCSSKGIFFFSGVWHIVTPLHNLIDGDIDVGAFIGLGIGYIILAGMMGIKWALMYRMTR